MQEKTCKKYGCGCLDFVCILWYSELCFRLPEKSAIESGSNPVQEQSLAESINFEIVDRRRCGKNNPVH
ncbi:MAG: hypothetical protein ACR2LL_04905 [Nitrosopumilus sp.]